MSHFLGTHLNRLDSKGRVSVPSPFRTALRARAGETGPIALVLRRSHKHPCVEAWPTDTFEALAAPLSQLDVFGEDQEDMATVLYAGAYPVEADREGRIVLHEKLVAHAALKDAVAFMGVGKIFQIWEPAAAERREQQAEERARQRSLTLPGVRAS